MKKLKISFNAPVTLSLVMISFVVTMVSISTNGQSTQLFSSTENTSLMNLGTYFKLLLRIFDHEGMGHFTANASYLLLLGPLLEEKYGSGDIVKVIIVTALVNGIINFLFYPTTAIYGASGIVFAFILLASFAGLKNGELPITFILVAMFFIGQEIYDGILFEDNVSQMSHIIGGVVGACFGYYYNCR